LRKFAHTQTYYELVAAEQPGTKLTIGPLQLSFEKDADGERPDDQAHDAQPGTDRTQHSATPLHEFIEDPMKKRGRE
jgi:hypothetical protein